MTTVRLVLPHEYELYRQHLKSLDAESRNLRFGYPVPDEVIDRLCDRINKDKQHHILFCVENEDLEFVAVGHISTFGTMELAFSVLKQYRGMGLGSAVLERSIQWCRTHGKLKGCMVCLTHNKKIQHLCRKHGLKLQQEHGAVLANVDLSLPTPVTYIAEQMDSTMAIMDYISKRTLAPWTLV